MNYQLIKTTNKNGTFNYQVIDENNNVISTRTSKREFVACTIYGTFCFGRLDLIGKGDHARFLKDLERNPTNESIKRLELDKIAYLKK